MEEIRAEDVTLEGLCGSAVRLTIDVGPEFEMTEGVAEKLHRIEELFAEVAREAVAATDEVSGFVLDGGSLVPSPVRSQDDLLAQFGSTRQISNKYGCHCVTNGPMDNR